MIKDSVFMRSTKPTFLLLLMRKHFYISMQGAPSVDAIPCHFSPRATMSPLDEISPALTPNAFSADVWNDYVEK